MNAIYSPNRRISCDVNGQQGVDLSQIKCPICHTIMQLHSVDEETDEYNAHLDMEPSVGAYGAFERVYHAEGLIVNKIGLLCPNCSSELTVRHATHIIERQNCY